MLFWYDFGCDPGHPAQVDRNLTANASTENHWEKTRARNFRKTGVFSGLNFKQGVRGVAVVNTVSSVEPAHHWQKTY